MAVKSPLVASVRAKLASTSGETLIETLAAVIVAGLGMLMLVMAVAVAANMIRQSDEAATRYYAASDALAAQSVEGDGVEGSAGSNASVSITMTGFGVDASTGGSTIPGLSYVSVSVPGNADPVVAYGQGSASEG